MHRLGVGATGEEEPLPAHHPLIKLRNVVLTPHLGYVTAETYRLFYTQAVEDIPAGGHGQITKSRRGSVVDVF